MYGEDGVTYVCRLRGKQRLFGEVFVGDRVEFTTGGKYGNIEKVEERKNSLTRPYVANIDVALIVVSPLPLPDLVLVDKLVASCVAKDIEPVICLNKEDMESEDVLSLLKSEYGEHFRVLSISAENGTGLQKILSLMEGKTVCMCGQSAVGKTTLVNALTGRDFETGGLSKINRGRNTTRHIETYKVGGGFLIDTCGFSLLELEGIDYRELALYYPDFDLYREGCKFNTCTHIDEPVCGVKDAVIEGRIPKGRYERYKILFNELKQKGGRY